MFANPFCFRYSWTTVLTFVLLVVTTNASEDATNVTDEKSSIYFPYTIEKFGVLLQSTSSISQNETDIIFSDDLVDSILAPTIQETLYDALGGQNDTNNTTRFISRLHRRQRTTPSQS